MSIIGFILLGLYLYIYIYILFKEGQELLTIEFII